MVQFQKNEQDFDTFSITILGDKEGYINLMKSLLTMIRLAPINKNELFDEFYDVCNLLTCMLPDKEQIISLEDAKLLKIYKAQQNK